MTNYTLLERGEQAEGLLEQPVKILGRRSDIIMQHMMAAAPVMRPDGTFTRKREFAFDTEALGQILVYYADELEPMAFNQRLVVYGVLREVSGPGKGGGKHSEYYVDLDRLEFV